MGFENPQAIYKWISGRSLPSLDNFVILSRLLHTSIAVSYTHLDVYKRQLIHIMIHTLVGNSLPAKKPYGMKVNHSMQ